MKSSISKITLMGLFLAAFALPAMATKPGNNGGGNGGCGQGQQTNGCGTTTPTQPSAGNNSASASATAAALGVGVGVGIGGNGGQGGQGGRGGDAEALGIGGSSIAGGGNVSGINVGTGDEGSTYVAPAPVMTMVPQSNGGVVTKSHAVSLGWNLVSWSKSDQATDPFQGGMRLIKELEAACQFESASMLRQHMSALLFPSYRELPAQPGVVNMTVEQCAARRK